ncbi:MAG: tetratricopeptide repeat protein [Spirochaetes bacterium]|nr:tetratricopeptide repeat protein [Spirochaetota bacterium]
MKKTEAERATWDIENYILEAQRLSNRGKYSKAIELLESLVVKFPGQETVTIKYLIGFNLYQAKRPEEAKSYFDAVKSMFETENFSEAERADYQKFVILSDVMLAKIAEDSTGFDPYHIKEDQKDKKIRPKKDTRNN